MTASNSTSRQTVDGHLTAALDAIDRGDWHIALECVFDARREIETELQFQAAKRGKA